MAKAKKQENTEVTESAEKPAKKPAKAKATKAAEETPTAAAAPAETPAPAKVKKPAAKAKAAAAPAEEEKPATKAAAAKPAEKTTTAAKPAEKAAVKPAAAAAPAKAEAKPEQSKPAAAKPSGTPTSNPFFSGIDTSQAARAAASVVANRDLLGGLGSSKPDANATKPEQKVESSSFKSLKQSLNQPAGLGKLFGGGNDGKKGGLPFGSGGAGSLRNQTGSANKLGVPRRTNG